jgi:hypothetical protein
MVWPKERGMPSSQAQRYPKDPTNGVRRYTPPSPTRAALAAHYRTIKELDDRLRLLEQPIRDYTAAQEEENKARKALESVTDLEAADWKCWTAAPAGTPPGPRDTERELAIATLADAHAKTMALKRGADSVAEELTRTQARLSQLHSQSKQLVRDVMLEDAQALGRQYVETLRSVFAIEGALTGIRNALTKMGDGGGAETVAVILRGGVMPEPKAQRPEPPASPPTIKPPLPPVVRDGFSGYPERKGWMSGPPSASVEIPGAQSAITARADFIATAQRNSRRAMALAEALGRNPHAQLTLDTGSTQEDAT